MLFAVWWLIYQTGKNCLCPVQATDCSFLYFNLEILDAALSEACTRPEEARKLPYILAAFSDAHSLLGSYSDSPGSSHEVNLLPQLSTLHRHCLC